MVNKLAVLLAVEYLEQRGGRIALVVAAKLVHFVKNQNRVVGTRILNRRNNASGNRAYVGAAVTADFRFIPYAAECDSLAVSSDSVRDGFGYRRLADARRTYKADDLSLLLGAELSDSKLFNDSVLDFFKAEMRFIQFLADAGYDDFILCRMVPRQIENRVQITADHGRLLAAVRHFHQLAALLEQNVLALFIKLQLDDSVRVLLRVLNRIVVLSQLLLNHTLLLTQEKVALTFINALLRLVTDFVFQTENIIFINKNVENVLQPLGRINYFKNTLFCLVIQRHVRGNIIRQLARASAKGNFENNIRRHRG